MLVSTGQGERLWKAFTLLLRRRVEAFTLGQVKDKAAGVPDWLLISFITGDITLAPIPSLFLPVLEELI